MTDDNTLFIRSISMTMQYSDYGNLDLSLVGNSEALHNLWRDHQSVGAVNGLRVVASEWKCIWCGSPNPMDHRHCSQCGAPRGFILK